MKKTIYIEEKNLEFHHQNFLFHNFEEEGVSSPTTLLMKSVLENGISDRLPYPHFILEPFSRDFLLKLKDEMLSLGSTFKETDLFRINQTVDFANLTADQCPQLNELKQTLYSEKFRSHIEQVTKCGKLNTRVDCAGNV